MLCFRSTSPPACDRSDDRSELLDLVASNARSGLRTLLLLTHDHVAPPVPHGRANGEGSTGHEVLKTPLNIGLYIRQRALKVLRSSEIVRAWIVERDRYFGFFDPIARLQ